jgi:hypothetical protein
MHSSNQSSLRSEDHVDMDRDYFSSRHQNFVMGLTTWGQGSRGSMKIGLYGSYHGLTAWIFQPIVWSTTPLHQDPDFEFISRAFWGDFCYKITSGCVGYDIVTL